MSVKKDIVAYLLGKAAPAIVNLAIIVLGVRILGEAEFGRYSLVYWTIMLVHSFSIGWIKQGILRFFKEAENKGLQPSGTFHALTLLSSIVSAVGFLIVSLLFVPLSVPEFMACLVYLLLLNVFIEQTTLLQAQLRSAMFVRLEVIYYLGALLLFTAAIAAINSPGFIVIIGANAIALIGALLYKMLASGAGSFSLSLHNKQLINQTMSFGFPMSVWLLGSLLFNISDRYLIEYFINIEAVGKYSAIADLAFKMSGFMCIPVLLALHPRIVAQWVDKRFESALSLLYKGIAAMTVIAIVATTLLLLAQPFLLNTVLKLDVEAGYMLTVPLLVAGFLWQIIQLIHKPLELTLKQIPMLWAIGISLLFNVVGNVILLPRYGYVAAAYTTLGGMFVYIAIVLIANRMALKDFKSNT